MTSWFVSPFLSSTVPIQDPPVNSPLSYGIYQPGRVNCFLINQRKSTGYPLPHITWAHSLPQLVTVKEEYVIRPSLLWPILISRWQGESFSFFLSCHLGVLNVGIWNLEIDPNMLHRNGSQQIIWNKLRNKLRLLGTSTCFWCIFTPSDLAVEYARLLCYVSKVWSSAHRGIALAFCLPSWFVVFLSLPYRVISKFITSD